MKKGISSRRKFNRVIRVGVGYGWQGGVDHDNLWKSLKRSLEDKCAVFDREVAKVDIRRLRACHGKLVWPSIKERIDSSDILVFDIAKAPKGSRPASSGLCANVLIELGAALSNLKKPVLLMCPDSLKCEIPSDMSGYLWSLYKWRCEKGAYVREFSDPRGLSSAFQSMLREVLEEFGEVQA